MVNIWSACATPMFTAALTVLGTPPANAAVCGSVGGAHVDVGRRITVSGCI